MCITKNPCLWSSNHQALFAQQLSETIEVQHQAPRSFDLAIANCCLHSSCQEREVQCLAPRAFEEFKWIKIVCSVFISCLFLSQALVNARMQMCQYVCFHLQNRACHVCLQLTCKLSLKTLVLRNAHNKMRHDMHGIQIILGALVNDSASLPLWSRPAHNSSCMQARTHKKAAPVYHVCPDLPVVTHCKTKNW